MAALIDELGAVIDRVVGVGGGLIQRVSLGDEAGGGVVGVGSGVTEWIGDEGLVIGVVVDEGGGVVEGVLLGADAAGGVEGVADEGVAVGVGDRRQPMDAVVGIVGGSAGWIGEAEQLLCVGVGEVEMATESGLGDT